MRHRTLLRLTLANCALVMVAFVAVPLPPSAPAEAEPTRLPPRADRTPLDAAVRGLSSDDPAARAHAARLLGALGDRRGAAYLAALRDDRDPEVAREAVLALAAVTRDPSLVRQMAARAVEDERTVRALASSADPAADDELAALASPRDAFVRGEALRALARRAPDLAVPRIASALRDADPVVRFHALEAAQTVTAPSLVPPLRELRESSDATERRLAVAALARAGEPGASDELGALLDEARAAGDAWLALLAAESMATAGVPRGAERWRRALTDLDDAQTALAVARLRTRPTPSLDGDLRRLLDAASPDVRVAAALVLAEHGDRSATAVLRAAAGDATCADAAECAVALAALSRAEAR